MVRTGSGFSHHWVYGLILQRVRYGIKTITWLCCVALSAAAPIQLTAVTASARLIWTGVAETADGRIFVEFPRLDDSPNPSLAELHPDGSLSAYPGHGWNGYKLGADPTEAFVSTASVQIGQDGALWVLDNGAIGLGARQPVANAQKIVVIDPKTNAVTRTYRLGPGSLRPHSAIADIRFNGPTAYITDAGAPGLIVLDLKTGAARRVLDRDPSTTALRPAIVDGHILRGADGKPASINADQLEISPDRRFLYYQPLAGPMYRVATRLLDDPHVPPVILSKQVEFWYNTPSLGGSVMDPRGNLYLNDLGSDAVLKLTPDRRLSLVLRDERLHWADAPAFDGHGNLLLPVSQLDRTPPFNHGRDLVHWPVMLYRLPLGEPSPSDD